MKGLVKSTERPVTRAEQRISAFAVSRGIGFGRTVFIRNDRRRLVRIELDASEIESELLRFRRAVDRSSSELKELSASEDISDPVSSIFGVHLLILEQSSLIEKVESTICGQKVDVESALKQVSTDYRRKQMSVDGKHFQEKHLDLEDVCERILKALSSPKRLAEPDYSGSILVARELVPSAILEIIKQKPAAIITERGGWTSHTSILAREFGLPMVSGIKDVEEFLAAADFVIVDGINGEVILDPTAETVSHYTAIANLRDLPDAKPADIEPRAKTLDSVEITIRANVDIPEAYQLARQYGADGVGLFRSESLITEAGIVPGEDEQVFAYRQMAEVAGEAGVNVRTFDVGPEYFDRNAGQAGLNPALGLRSIRLSLDNSKHFRTQIRAILRASFDRRVDILLPMVSGVAEIIRSKAIISEERLNLETAGIPVGSPRLGAMIEVPSGILTADEIAQKVDFLSLGTNDLVQYLLAVDRDNDSVAEWYQTLHPAIIRAIKTVVLASEKAKIPLTICGEMAGAAFYVPLLVGLGVRELSMNINSVYQIRQLISGITSSKTTELVEKVRLCETAEETEAALREFYQSNWANLFPFGLLNSRHR